MRKNDLTLTIDDRKVTVPAGISVLLAARQAGINIPTLCYHEKLSPSSACRLCVVEIKGSRTLVASCARAVEEDMVVRTDTERVIKARKMVLELMLSDHPTDCLTCEKCGVCRLQDYAYQYQVTRTRFHGAWHNYPIDHANPFIERDFNKCIVCYRCAKVCQEVQYCYVIDYMNRGFDTMVTSYMDEPLPETPCVFCGRCVSVCPVGALTEKVSRFKGREQDLKQVATTCPYCGVGCTIELNVADGRVVKVTSNEDSLVNKGSLCVKGRFGHEFIHHPERLKVPLIRKGGRLVPASWDTALKLVATRLADTKKKHGADSIGVLASSKCTNEENYLIQRFARAALGTNNVDNCARLCHAPTVAGLAMAFGSGAMTNPMSDIAQADVILLTGSNTTSAHPVLGLEIISAVKRGAKLIVVEPRRIHLVDHASLWLSQRPGTDVAVFNGIMNVILTERLADDDFIKKRTEDFASLKKTVAKYTPEYVEKISGVAANQIIDAARLYGGADRGSIIFAMGITQHTTGTDNVLALADLAMLTGNVGRPGTGVNPLRGQNNVQGACDVGALPNLLPGYKPVDDEKAGRKFAAAWRVKRLPAKPGLPVTEMIGATLKGKLKAMYIMGENPMMSDPDLGHVAQALKRLDFLVVADIFLSETARLADVVLPAASFAEKSGTFTNTERRVQPVRQAIEPIGDSRPDWRIICDLSALMGHEMKYERPAEITDEIASVTPQYGGIVSRRVEVCGIQWPCPTPDHPGTPVLHTKGFTRGKGKFHAIEFKRPAEVPDKEYPLYLTTGRYLYQFHTGTMTRRVPGLEETAPIGWAEINPVDAEAHGIKDGSAVTVATRRGKIKTRAMLTEVSPRGTVFLPFHYSESAANKLTNAALDPVAKIAEFKVCACKVAPA